MTFYFIFDFGLASPVSKLLVVNLLIYTKIIQGYITY